MVLWVLMNGRRIFNEFLGKSNPFVFEPQVYKNVSFRRIVLKPKSWILIPKDFEFLDIFIESKWGVFPYLHLCFKVNGE